LRVSSREFAHKLQLLLGPCLILQFTSWLCHEPGAPTQITCFFS